MSAAAAASVVGLGVQVVALAAVAGLVAAVLAAGYRWYARDAVPVGAVTLVALSAVALYLNAKTALGQVVAGQTEVLAFDVAVFNLVALAAAAVATPAGREAGDRLARSTRWLGDGRSLDAELGRLVAGSGRVVTVTLPDEIGDVEGYEPVDPERKAQLAGRTLTFPRGLTVGELRERLVDALRDDYGVSYVDVELGPEGAVEYLGVGSRAVGLGHTLPPGTAAVAVTADPPNAATAGDLVQVRPAADPTRRGATGELRAVAGDVVTLALDDHVADAVAGQTHRLVTLPREESADREFAALLRAADETMAAIELQPGSPLVGLATGALAATVVAVAPADGPIDPIPRRSRPLAAGDVLYLVARPETLRGIEGRAAPG